MVQLMKQIPKNFIKALKIANEFHNLAIVAARNGGFWVSAGGGTANVVANEICKKTGVSFEQGLKVLDLTGGKDWYMELAMSQPWPIHTFHEEIPGRWDVITIARAACARVLS